MAQSARQNLDLAQKQRASLSASVMGGMEILSLSALELVEFLLDVSEENPFLVVNAPPDRGFADPASVLGSTAEEETLAQRLRHQIVCMDLPGDVRRLALLLASDLDHRGYLPESDAEIANALGEAPDLVARARAAVQACEPVGVGAADLADCLRLQLVDRGMAEARARLVCDHLDLLARGEFSTARNVLGGTEAEMLRLVSMLAELSPEPGLQSDASAPVHAIPEIEIRTGPSGQPECAPLEASMARVAIDQSLVLRTADRSPRSAVSSNSFRRDHEAARRILSGVSFRYRTLHRIGAALAEIQAPYFLGQTIAPTPLSRADIAAWLGVHPATVGRAIRGASLLHNGRSYPLTAFFPSALKGLADRGVSSAEAQVHIRALVAAETPETVLSDEEIVERLQERGVDIARRTVAKYRKDLRIPSKGQRRKRLALQARRSQDGLSV